MSETLLPAVTLEPRDGEADASVVLLHGLGADGHDFEPIVGELGLGPTARVRFVFPHAPSIPVTLNGGMVMPAWYDIVEMDLQRRHDEEGILRSSRQLAALVEREQERGVPSERIVVAGFSQGGAVALHQGLRHPERLGGIVALSTYLVRERALGAERHAVNQNTPIFQAHGSHDPMVPMPRGEEARSRLLEWGYEVEWHQYPMAHQVCLEEIQALGRWLEERVG